MTRTQTTVTKEYDKDGNLVSETTETVNEEDSNGSIYPPPQSWWPHVCPARLDPVIYNTAWSGNTTQTNEFEAAIPAVWTGEPK